MRRPPPDSGFLRCLLFNLYFRSGWGVLALGLWALRRFWLQSIPWYVPLTPLGLWMLAALFVTLFLSWTVGAFSVPSPPQENKNPYSAKNEDYFP